MLFTTDIVGAARAPEDPHNIFLSEPLAPIMKFHTRANAFACASCYSILFYVMQVFKKALPVEGRVRYD